MPLGGDVYSRGDANRPLENEKKKDKDKGDKKKKDIGDEIGAAFDKMGKGISDFFGGKEKKWEKKGGGHQLGTAADAEAARQARLAALSGGAAGSSASHGACMQREGTIPSSGSSASSQP